jgi:hypothetical protein
VFNSSPQVKQNFTKRESHSVRKGPAEVEKKVELGNGNKNKPV